MTFNYIKNTTKKHEIPVTKKITGTKKNDGGGYSHVIGKWEFLDRFLIIGAESGTYYVSQEENQQRNCDNTIACIVENGIKVVDTVVEVSAGGKAAKNDSAIYVLALCFTHGNDETKQYAEKALQKVCRIGTHILMFVAFIKSMRGFGKSVARAINAWYTDKTDDALAFQLTKYQNRNGWTHKDVFRLSHPKFGKRNAKSAIAKWVVTGEIPKGKTKGQSLIRVIDSCRGVEVKKAIPIIKEHNLQREHLDTNLLNDVSIQAAMLDNLGGTALVRNLGNMTKSGLLHGNNEYVKNIYHKLNDKEYIAKSKLHPLKLLIALNTYNAGGGGFGASYVPNQTISSSLEAALALSFNSVKPTNENYFFGLDVSGSMGWEAISGVSCCAVASVMALTFAKVEPWTFIGGFSGNFTELGISKADSVNSAMDKAIKTNFGSTNPSAAIEYAIQRKMDVDKFVFITDNDCNRGYHASETIKKYRSLMNKPKAKIIVFGLTASQFSIADKNDPFSLDVAGTTPDMTSIIQNF